MPRDVHAGPIAVFLFVDDKMIAAIGDTDSLVADASYFSSGYFELLMDNFYRHIAVEQALLFFPHGEIPWIRVGRNRL